MLLNISDMVTFYLNLSLDRSVSNSCAIPPSASPLSRSLSLAIWMLECLDHDLDHAEHLGISSPLNYPRVNLRIKRFWTNTKFLPRGLHATAMQFSKLLAVYHKKCHRSTAQLSSCIFHNAQVRIVSLARSKSAFLARKQAKQLSRCFWRIFEEF